MQHAVLKSLAAAGTLALAIAACSSSGTQSGSGNAASGKTLVIESTSVTAPGQNFNPYVQSATGFSAQATGLISEPLYIFNIMNPTSQPAPMLASGQPVWSDGGKTLTVPIRSGVKWSDGKPFTASDVAGNGSPTAWQADFNNGNFDATIHWSNQGPNPFYYYENWIDHTFSAPIGKPAAGDNGRFQSPEAQAALAQFAGTNDPATQKEAITSLQHIMSTQVPMTPLLYGAGLERDLDAELHRLADERQRLHDAGAEQPVPGASRPAPRAGRIAAARPRERTTTPHMRTAHAGLILPGRETGRAGAHTTGHGRR